MTFDTGTIITIVCVLLFYLRLIVIQRHRVKTAKYQYAQVEKKLSKNKKTADKKPDVNYARLGIHIRSWMLVIVALALITFGTVVIATHFLGPVLSAYYWIPLNLGIIIFAFAIN